MTRNVWVVWIDYMVIFFRAVFRDDENARLIGTNGTIFQLKQCRKFTVLAVIMKDRYLVILDNN